VAEKDIWPVRKSCSINTKGVLSQENENEGDLIGKPSVPSSPGKSAIRWK